MTTTGDAAARRPSGGLYLIADQRERRPAGTHLRSNLVRLRLEDGSVETIVGDSLFDAVLGWRGTVLIHGWRDEDPSVRLWWWRDDNFEPVPSPSTITAAAVSPQDDALAFCTSSDNPVAGSVAVAPGPGGPATTVIEDRCPYVSLSYLDDGGLAVLEGKRRRKPQHLVVVDQDGTIKRIDLSPLGDRWTATAAYAGPNRRLALACEVGPEDRRAGALVSVASGGLQVEQRLERWHPIGASRDFGAVLLARRLPSIGADLAWCRFADWSIAGWIGRVPVWPKAAWWESSPPEGEFERFEIASYGSKPAADTAFVRRELSNVEVGPGAWRRLVEEYAGTLTVALEGPDVPALSRVLARAREDLYWLGTSREDEGEVEIPSHVSAVVESSTCASVTIDANDTGRELMKRIPEILDRHLREAGLRATLRLDQDDE